MPTKGPRLTSSTAEFAHKIRFLREEPRLDGIYELKLLNEVLQGKNLPEVHDVKH